MHKRDTAPDSPDVDVYLGRPKVRGVHEIRRDRRGVQVVRTAIGTRGEGGVGQHALQVPTIGVSHDRVERRKPTRHRPGPTGSTAAASRKARPVSVQVTP